MFDFGDSEEALRWFRRAADQGLASAQFWIGQAYERGSGVSRDLVAVRAFDRSTRTALN